MPRTALVTPPRCETGEDTVLCPGALWDKPCNHADSLIHVNELLDKIFLCNVCREDAGKDEGC